MFQHLFKKYILSVLSCAIFFGGFFLTFVPNVYAASLQILPAVTTVTVGNIVSMKVTVNTDGKTINNADTVIQFPADLLEVMSVSKTSSIFTLWVEEPKFSNYTGQISFNGGLPNPGYVGQSGELLSVTFKAKKQGSASIVFSDSAVRQNDGLGTDILAGKQSATIQINSAAGLEIPAVNTSSNSFPVKPTVVSSTHPDQDAWYSGSSASFSWVVPNDVTSLQTLLSKSSTAVPTVTYDNSVSQRTVNNLTDGILYFHVRYQNNVGWGPVAHYKVQIDSTAPEKFSVNVKNSGVQNILSLNAYDALSGIDSYSIKIDDQPAFRIKKDTLINSEYVLPTQQQGDHSLSVVAYDRAGNHTEANTLFASPAIVAPTVSVEPIEILRNDTATISGTSLYTNTPVDIFVENKKTGIKLYQAKTNDNGSYSVITDKQEISGSIHISAQLVFSNTVKSPVSEKITLQVSDTMLVRTSKSVIYTLSFIIPMLILILILIFISYVGWHKFFGLKRKIHKDVENTIGDIHKAMSTYKDELSSQLVVLEKLSRDRDLTRKEEKIFKELQDNIDNVEKFIEKKLKKY